MAKELIEHINKENLGYFAQELHDEILTHIKMTNPAQDYWQHQYDKLFNTTYTYSMALSAAPSSINPKELAGTSKSVVLTATVGCEKTINTPDGQTKSYPTINDITDIPDGWTKINATQLQKTVIISDFTKNHEFQCAGTIIINEEWDEGSEHNSPTQSATTTVKITKPNLWSNDLAAIDGDIFDEHFKGLKGFNTGKNQEFQSVTGKPLIFLSTSGSLNFEQSGNSIIIEKKTINTSLGTYYAYITGKGNGSVWNSVTIS